MESEIVEHTVSKQTINISASYDTHCIGEHDDECTSIINLASSPAVGAGDFAIDVKQEEDDILKDEIICRICQLSNCFDDHVHDSMEPAAAELIELGCDCRGELGMSHRYCAQTWFNHRGNRSCEICGVIAKNVTITKKATTRIWIVDFNDMRPTTFAGNSFAVAAAASSSRGNSTSSSSTTTRMCKQTCCNLLLACIVLGLVIPWFFRIKLF